MPQKILAFAESALVDPVTVNVGRAGAANLDVIQEVCTPYPNQALTRTQSQAGQRSCGAGRHSGDAPRLPNTDLHLRDLGPSPDPWRLLEAGAHSGGQSRKACTAASRPSSMKSWISAMDRQLLQVLRPRDLLD